MASPLWRSTTKANTGVPPLTTPTSKCARRGPRLRRQRAPPAVECRDRLRGVRVFPLDFFRLGVDCVFDILGS